MKCNATIDIRSVKQQRTDSINLSAVSLEKSGYYNFLVNWTARFVHTRSIFCFWFCFLFSVEAMHNSESGGGGGGGGGTGPRAPVPPPPPTPPLDPPPSKGRGCEVVI